MRRERVVREDSDTEVDLELDAGLQKLIDRLEDGLQFDQHALDDALQEQPQMVYDVSKALALFISRRDAAKQNVKVVEAQEDLAIRKAAAADGDKVTEKQVEQELRLSKKVQDAQRTLLRLDHAVSMLGALKDAIQSRGYVLKDMSALYMADYYSSASAGSAGNRLRDHRHDETRRAMDEERRKAR